MILLLLVLFDRCYFFPIFGQLLLLIPDKITKLHLLLDEIFSLRK